jgi:peptidoglycan-N-acetylglucosamine deacetylase
MDDGATALRNRTRPRSSAGSPGPARRRSMAPHHRRRRAFATLALVAILLLGVVALSTGGHSTVRHQVAGGRPGYFDRLRALAGNGPRSFAGIERAQENGAIDRTLAYTPYVRIAGGQHREIALTFDDGPGPYTPEVLSILRRRNAPATFFEVGVLERYFHASTAQIVADGYTIGDHTESHAPMSRLSAAEQQSQLLRQTALIGQYGASFPRLFRPPYGLWNSTTLALLHQYRMLMVLWTVDTSDYRRPGIQAIVDSVVSGARPGAIILMHDGGGDRAQTAAALPRIIATLRARGYRFVTVPKLLLDNPAPINQQISALTGSGG